MRLGDWQDTSDLRLANMAEINIIRLMFDISLYHGMDNKGKKTSSSWIKQEISRSKMRPNSFIFTSTVV